MADEDVFVGEVRAAEGVDHRVDGVGGAVGVVDGRVGLAVNGEVPVDAGVDEEAVLFVYVVERGRAADECGVDLHALFIGLGFAAVVGELDRGEVGLAPWAEAFALAPFAAEPRERERVVVAEAPDEVFDADELLDAAGGVGVVVEDVADGDEAVLGRVELRAREDLSESREVAVDVADDQCPHHC